MKSDKKSRIRISSKYRNAWRLHKNYWKNCQQCNLCEERDRVVLFRGNIPCNILFVGEAPGKSEDALGFPFVGEAGILFNDLIDKAFRQTGFNDNKLQNIKIGFTNIVACMPLNDDGELRSPVAREAAECRERLMQMITIALGSTPGSKAIVLVGKVANKFLENVTLPTLKSPYTLDISTIKHPAAILRQDGGTYSLSCKRSSIKSSKLSGA